MPAGEGTQQESIEPDVAVSRHDTISFGQLEDADAVLENVLVAIKLVKWRESMMIVCIKVYVRGSMASSHLYADVTTLSCLGCQCFLSTLL